MNEGLDIRSMGLKKSKKRDQRALSQMEGMKSTKSNLLGERSGLDIKNLVSLKLQNINFPILDQLRSTTKSYASRKKKINFLQDLYTPQTAAGGLVIQQLKPQALGEKIRQEEKRLLEGDKQERFFLGRLNEEQQQKMVEESGEKSSLFRNDFIIRNKLRPYLNSKSSLSGKSLDLNQLSIDQRLLQELNRSLQSEDFKKQERYFNFERIESSSQALHQFKQSIDLELEKRQKGRTIKGKIFENFLSLSVEKGPR